MVCKGGTHAQRACLLIFMNEQPMNAQLLAGPLCSAHFHHGNVGCVPYLGWLSRRTFGRPINGPGCRNTCIHQSGSFQFSFAFVTPSYTRMHSSSIPVIASLCVWGVRVCCVCGEPRHLGQQTVCRQGHNVSGADLHAHTFGYDEMHLFMLTRWERPGAIGACCPPAHSGLHSVLLSGQMLLRLGSRLLNRQRFARCQLCESLHQVLHKRLGDWRLGAPPQMQGRAQSPCSKPLSVRLVIAYVGALPRRLGLIYIGGMG